MFIDDKAHGESTIQDPSVPGFLEFCRMKNPRLAYLYHNSLICACAQYAKFIGASDEWQYADNRDCWSMLDALALPFPHTFGALAERLEMYLEQR
jgi:hypothetical protein